MTSLRLKDKFFNESLYFINLFKLVKGLEPATY